MQGCWSKSWRLSLPNSTINCISSKLDTVKFRFVYQTSNEVTIMSCLAVTASSWQRCWLESSRNLDKTPVAAAATCLCLAFFYRRVSYCLFSVMRFAFIIIWNAACRGRSCEDQSQHHLLAQRRSFRRRWKLIVIFQTKWSRLPRQIHSTRCW